MFREQPVNPQRVARLLAVAEIAGHEWDECVRADAQF